MIKTEIELAEFEEILDTRVTMSVGIIEQVLTPMLITDAKNDTETIFLDNKVIAIREQALFYKVTT